MKSKTSILLLAILTFVGVVAPGAPIGTAFTYQGRLNDGTNAANNLYDLDFTLFDVPAGGTQLGMSVTFNGHPVSNGLFAVTLDFGASLFNGEARWLQIQVRTNGGRITPWTLLSPRQALTPSPYALYAPSAGTALATAPGSVSNLSLAPGAVTSDKIADGAITGADLSPVLASNTFWRLGGNSGTLPGLQFLGTTDSQPVEFQVNGQRALRLEPGPNGTPNVLGGSVSNRVAAGVSGGAIGGGFQNTVGTAANFATIGGGYGNTIQASAWQSIIGGGGGNTIQSNAYISTISGGSDNLIQSNAKFSTIAGGEQNTVQSDAYRATIGGGSSHTIEAGATNSIIGGGYGNTIQLNAWDATIGGGTGNAIQRNASGSTIGGGIVNTIESNTPNSTIGGGVWNTIKTGAYESIIGGGKLNTIEGSAVDSTISGGYGNLIDSDSGSVTVGSTIGGGIQNLIQEHASDSTIGGGSGNLIESYLGSTPEGGTTGGTIGGGVQNSLLLEAAHSTIGGGEQNAIKVGTSHATIGGGRQNSIEADAYDGTISGGQFNLIGANAWCSAIGGGEHNTVGGSYATIGGGEKNSVEGSYATVPGGRNNSAAGDYSLAAGSQARALHGGTFVWADATRAHATNVNYESTGTNQFCIRASGGLQLSPGTSLYCGSQVRQMLNLWSTNYGIGVQGGALYFRASDDTPGNAFAWYLGGGHHDDYLNSGGGATLMSLNNAGLTVNGTFVSASDRNRKENFAAVNPSEVLDKVTALPISRWNFKGDAGTPHVGPMAQDFHAAFGLGTDDKHIATVDADGVALAAIQGLNRKMETENTALRAELKAKDAALHSLQQRLEAIEQKLNNRAAQ